MGSGNSFKSATNTVRSVAQNPKRLAAAGATSGVSEVGSAAEDKIMGHSAKAAARRGLAGAQEEQYNTMLGSNQRMNAADTSYYDQSKKQYDDYFTNTQQAYQQALGRNERNLKQAQEEATDARQTYTGTIKPNLVNAMEDARTQAGQAMSLKDAGDPNNAVHTAVRGMYDTQAQQEGKRGLADAGVLAGLGAQAFGNQLGAAGGPMTGSQMSILANASQAQSGAAYANTQRRMANLRDQGLQQGFIESDRQYQRGERARDRYSNTIGDVQRGSLAESQRGEAARNEQTGLADRTTNMKYGRQREKLGAGQAISGLQYGQAQAGIGRDQAAEDYRLGNKQQGYVNQMNDISQRQAGVMGALSSGIQGGATALGYAYGGPAGGAAAGGAASGLGNAAQSGVAGPQQGPMTPQQQGSYGTYGPGMQRPMNPYSNYA